MPKSRTDPFLIRKTKVWGGTSSTSSLYYSYDLNGNLTNILSSDPNGVDVGYEYDALNRLSAVNDAKVGRTTYGYDDVGNLAGSIYPNAVLNEYRYDALNRLTNLASGQLLTPLATYAYTVGASGNRLTASETLHASTLNTQPKTINRLYTYDALYRLTGEQITQNSELRTLNYGYDPVGNRQTRTSTLAELLPQTFTFDANDRLTSDQYDANGNTLQGRAGVPPAQIGGLPPMLSSDYDFENRLIQSATADGKTVYIQYDGDGNRVKKTVTSATNSVTTFYVVDEQNPTGYAQVLEEHVSKNSSTPTLQSVFCYGHTLISQDRLDGATWRSSFYGYDGHNNVRYLTDLNGNVTDTYDYDAFGNLIARTGNTPNNYLFTGEQYDPDLGLYYLRARYHNPDTGRFWSQDSFEGFGSDPTSLHKYIYCGNNPANAFDPSGHMTYSETGIAQTISLQTRLAYGSFWGLVGGASSAYTTYRHNGDKWGWNMAVNGAIGFGTGFAGGYFLGSLPASAWMTPGGLFVLATFSGFAGYNAQNEYQAGYTDLAAMNAMFAFLPFIPTARQAVMANEMSIGYRASDFEFSSVNAASQASGRGQVFIGKVEPPEGVSPNAWGAFGTAMHNRVVALIRAKYPTFTFGDNVGTGQNGPDLQIIQGDVGNTGWNSRFAEIKPDKPWQVGKMVRQVSNWKDQGLVPTDEKVQAITYDAEGNVYLNFSRP